MKFFTAYYPPLVSGLAFSEPSLTQQQFADEADINTLLNRYELTGQFYPNSVSRRLPKFGDFSSDLDYLQAEIVVAETNEYFDSLPARVRERFNHDPAQLLEFLSDPANRAEAERLQLVSRDETVISEAVDQSADLSADGSA